MKTRKLRKSMMSAVVILMAAVLSLTGATYAWFTTGDQATVDTISAGVEEGTGLLISTDGTSWTSKVTDIGIGEGFKYLAVSSAGKVTNGKLGIFSASLNAETQQINKIAVADDSRTDRVLAAEGVEPSDGTDASRNGGFVQFDLYFNNLNGGSKDIIISNSDISSVGLNKYAFRIAFIKQGELIGDEAKATNYLDALKAKSLTSGTATIYEPYATDHVVNGINDYKSNYDSDATGDSKFTYFGIQKAPTSTGTNVDRYLTSENTDDFGEYLAQVTTSDSTGSTYFTLSADSYTKVTVVIWLEGQDADCLNEVSGGSFNVKLGFTVATPSQGQ